MGNWVYNEVNMMGKQTEVDRFVEIGMDISENGNKMFNFHNFFTNTDVTINGIQYNELTEVIQNKIWSRFIQTSNGFYLSTEYENKSMRYETKGYPPLGFYITFGLMFDIIFKIKSEDDSDQYWDYIVYKGEIIYREFSQYNDEKKEKILTEDFMVYREEKFELDNNGVFNLDL